MSDWKILYPLHAASQSGDLELLKKLISDFSNKSDELNIKLNLLDDDNWSCLHYGSFYNHVDVIKLLISYGANVNIMDKLNRKPLHIASGCGNIDVIKLLKEKMSKDDINSKNLDKQTPLQVCKDIKPDNWKEIVELLES